MIEVLGIILGVWALIWLLQVNAKMTVISKELELLKRGHPSTPNTVQAATPQAQSLGVIQSTPRQNIPQQTAVIASAVVQTQKPYEEDAFTKWIKQDFFVKLGALLLLIGFGWFVSYAFAHQWIGPMGRITLGLLLGIMIMAFGAWRVRSFIHQGGIFLVLGSTTVLLTVFAARELYDFFTPTIALGVMFLSVLFVAFVSVIHKNENLALASLILAGIAPFLTSAPTTDVISLFAYLLVIVLGTLWVVRITGSHTLTFAALLVVILYGLPFAFDMGSDRDKDIALLFTFVFTTLFFVGNIISIIRQQGSVLQAHLATAFGTGMYLTVWIFVAAPKEFQSLLFSAWMLVFALGSFIVYRRSQHKAPFYIYSAISVGLLAAATAAELTGPVLTIAFTFEAGLIVLLARLLTKDVRIVQNVSWLFLVPVVLSMTSLTANTWKDGFLHGDFFVLITLAVVLMAACASLLERNEKGEESSMQLALTFGVVGGMYILALIWLVLHSILQEDVATTISLVTYAVLGLTLFVYGRMSGEKISRTAGGMLLGFVVARLFLIDVWNMELTGRIITFFAVGLLLISTAFIGKKKKQLDN